MIATLATRAADDGIDVVVVTGDRDSFQLVSRSARQGALQQARRLRLRALRRGRHRRAVRGVTPAQYTEYAALRGDTSDNLPGVPGIGEKTAAKLVTTYGDLEGDLRAPRRAAAASSDEPRRVQGPRVQEPRDVAARPRRRLRRRARRAAAGRVRRRTGPGPVRPARVPHAAAAPPRRGRRSRRGRPRRTSSRSRSRSHATRKRRWRRCSHAAAQSRVAIEPRWAGAPGAQPTRRPRGRRPTTRRHLHRRRAATRRRAVREALDALVAEASSSARRAPRQGAAPRTRTSIASRRSHHDTAVMAYLLDPGEGKYALEDLALRYLSVELHVTRPGRRHARSRRRLAAIERDRPPRRDRAPARRRRSRRRWRRASSTICTSGSSCRSCRCWRKMEAAGVRIDVDFLDAARQGARRPVPRRWKREIHAHAGEEFNVNSTPQLRRILFEKLGLTPVKKTKTGPSTDADSLQKMAEEHPIVETLLRYREVEKLRSTYADALPPLVGADGRIHATFNQLATTTGRISSESPNLQNIPVRTAGGRELRRAFVADDGCGLLTADYSQIELRVLAHLADDPGLIDAFERGADIHTTTAAQRVRRRRGQGRRVPAPLREGRQLRPRVRHGGLRTRAAPRHPDRSGARDPRRVLRRVPQRRRLHEGDGARSEGARVHHHDLRPAPPAPRAVVRQLPHPPDGRAHGAERAGAGFRRRHLQARDDRPRPRPRRPAASRAACCSPCTTSSCSRCRVGRTRDGRAGRARRHGERHRAAGPARRRHRLRHRPGPTAK